MATKIGDDHLIRILSSGDVASNEIFYHNENIKPCLANFHKKYQTECKIANGAVNKDDIDWLKNCALDKVYFCMYETEMQTKSSVFKVKDFGKYAYRFTSMPQYYHSQSYFSLF